MRRDETPLRLFIKLGQAHLRRIVDQQVYVVGFAVEFLQHRSEVGADRSEYFLQALDASGVEHLPSPFGDEHQVRMKDVNDVATLAYFHELDQYLKCFCSFSKYALLTRRPTHVEEQRSAG